MRGRETTANQALAGSGIALAGACAWLAAHGLGLLGPLADATLPLFTVAAITSVVIGVRRYRPAVTWPWYWLGAAFVLFLVGGIARVEYHTLGVLDRSRSLVPDLVTIPGYVVAAIGLFGIIHARQRGRSSEIDTLLDASVAALAALALGWLFVVNPSDLHASPFAVRMVLAVYPTLSVFLVAITASLAFTTGTRRIAANTLLLGAMAGVLVGDLLYMFVEIHAFGVPASLIDLPYAAGFLLVAAAVLHPSMRELTEPVPAAEDTPTVSRLIVVAVALAIPGVLTVTRVDSPLPDRIAMTLIVLSLTAAAITRLFRAVRAHARSEQHLVHQATHDMLTGLPNRAYVHEYLSQALAHLPETSSLIALLFLDVDRFKLVNDTYGHTHGDAFLLAVAQRLRHSIRPADIVARIGGDEFVIVVSGLRSTDEAIEIAERTRSLFAAPFEVNDGELASSVSIGVAIATADHDGTDAESMIRDADTAMYQAKDGGRDTVAVFDESMRDRVSHRLDLERDLHHALERDELEVHYQPVVDMASSRVTGFEALIRWHHPSWGMISPASFVPVAEETGIIVEIGSWVLQQACRQMAEWRETLPGGATMTMSVNVSARQLRDQGIVPRVQRALAQSGLDADALTVELTESTLMQDPTGGRALLGQLKALGICLAIDDFGTGYSSLAYLRRFPVDIVKIDRAFIVGLEQRDSADASLVAAIVAMSDALGVVPVAEGVESETQAAHLLELGCTIAQGYLYSRPVPADAIPGQVDRLAVRARNRLHSVRGRFSA